MTEKRIFLIDGTSQVFQAYYAIKGGFTASDGQPTNAVYGFTLMLQKILREKKPDYIAVAFDTSAPTFRHSAYALYKANRKDIPEDLPRQFDLIREILKGYCIPVFALEGYEADDVLGTLVRQASAKGLTTVIVTRDKDMLQLLDERVVVWDNKSDRFYGAEDLVAEKGIRPEQVVEMMALSGDTVDNVPGVPGVGPKTALELIRRYGSLESVLEHAPEITKPKLRQNLLEHAASARLSKELVTIDRNVPLDIDVEKLQACPPDRGLLESIFRRLDFHSLLPGVAETSSERGMVFHVVNTPEELCALAAELRAAEKFAFDTETTGLSPIDSELVGISFAVRPGEAWYVPVKCPPLEKCLPRELWFQTLKPFLEDASKSKVGQNVKFDIMTMRQAGVEVRGADFDTMVAAYLADPGRRRYSLDELAADYLSYRMIPIADLIGRGKKQITLDAVTCADVAQYACEDAEVALRLATTLRPELARVEQEGLFRDVEMPLVAVLARMEEAGVRIDGEYLLAMGREVEAEIAVLEKKIYEEAGREFNIASTQQLSEVLFKERKLASGKRTKTGWSTDVDVLERLAETDCLARLVLEYRGLAKLKSTYLDALPRMVSPKTGRVHCSFNQTGTSTGRLSSSDPNLQNIPVRTPLGRRIRRAFVTEPGNRLVAADYSQIELRITAHLSGDEALIEAFRNGEDIHSFVAREIYGAGETEVTSEMRRMAKAVNFGIIYGQTPYGLARGLGISVGEAAAFIDGYFARYPGVERYIDATLRAAMETGYVATILGRRRYVTGILAASPRNLNPAERAAVNATIQGSAADMIKLAMLDIDRRQRAAGSRARMILQIHDELVFEMPEEMVEEESHLIEEAMTGAMKLSVPVVVNISTGADWLEAGH